MSNGGARPTEVFVGGQGCDHVWHPVLPAGQEALPAGVRCIHALRRPWFRNFVSLSVSMVVSMFCGLM